MKSRGEEFSFEDSNTNQSSDDQITAQVVDAWENDFLLANDGSEKKLAQVILDKLEEERPHKNEQEMLNLINSFVSAMDNIKSRDPEIETQVKEALKLLGDKYSECKIIDEIE